jgi:hypothetical protein
MQMSTMKKLFVSAALASALLAAAPPPSTAAGTGIGVIAGEPTGLSLKTWLDGTHAIDVALGWSFSGDANVHVHADYLWHDFGLLRPSGLSGRLPVYFGIGGRFELRDSDHGDDRLGLRFPIGLAWIPQSAPLDVFVELAPVLDLVPGTDLRLNGAIGLRYWFR